MSDSTPMKNGTRSAHGAVDRWQRFIREEILFAGITHEHTFATNHENRALSRHFVCRLLSGERLGCEAPQPRWELSN